MTVGKSVRAMGAMGGSSLTAAMIEWEIARYRQAWSLRSLRGNLKFEAAAEQKFEDDVRASRISELRVTMLIATALFMGANVVNPVLLPDIATRGILTQLAVLPLLLASALLTPWMSNRTREIFVTFTAIVAVLAFESIPAMSHAPLSSYGLLAGPLALVYCNTTIPLRFKSACVASAVCGSIMMIEVFQHEAHNLPLAASISFQLVMSALFSLIPSYRTEHQTRLNLMMTARDALQVSGLSADREMLTMLSNTDALTGVSNRRFFDREIRARLCDPNYAGRSATLLMVDVDYFKRYNDKYGHPAGDACLRQVAGVLTGALRGVSDVVARYGGEEFVILLFDLDAEQARAIASRICTAVEAKAMPHHGRDDGCAVVTVSMGMSREIVAPHVCVDRLISAADQALYAAKRQGRNRVEANFALAA